MAIFSSIHIAIIYKLPLSTMVIIAIFFLIMAIYSIAFHSHIQIAKFAEARVVNAQVNPQVQQPALD